MAGPEVKLVRDPGNGNAGRRLISAVKEGSLERQPFELPDGGIVAGKDDAAAGFLDEEIHDEFFAPGHGERERLEDKDIVVAVDDKAGQLIRFGPDEATGGGRSDISAKGESVIETPAEKSLIERNRLPGITAGDDLGTGIVDGAAELLALGGADFDRAAVFGLAFDMGNFTRKNPGMAGENAMADALVEDEAGGMGHDKSYLCAKNESRNRLHFEKASTAHDGRIGKTMMEIHILLAGVEMGPFSENQVRDYLREGLLSHTDKAKIGEDGAWEPVEVVLEKIPRPLSPPAPGPAPVPVPAPAPPTANPTSSPSVIKVSPPTTAIKRPDAATANPTPPSMAVNPTTLAKGPSPSQTLPTKPTSSSVLPTIATSAVLKKLQHKKKPTRIIMQPIQPLTPSGPSKSSEQQTKPVVTRAIPHSISPRAPAQPATPTPPLPTPAQPAISVSPPASKPAPEPTRVQAVPPVTRPRPTGVTSEPPAQTQSTRVAVLRPAPIEPTGAPGAGGGAALLPPPLPQKRSLEREPTWIERQPPWAIYMAAGLIFIVIYLGSFTLTMPNWPSKPIPAPEEAPIPTPTPAGHTPVPASTTNPQSAADFNNRGFDRQKNGDLDGALADYSQSISLDPKDAHVFFRRGHVKQLKDDLDGAIDDYTQALGLDPSEADAYSNRGFAKQSKGDLDGAVADYTQALMLDPKIAEAFYNRGLIKERRSDIDGAISDYNHALDLDAKMDVAFYHRGNAKNSQGNLDGAIADYTQAISLNPKLGEAYCNRGFARQSKGDLAGAMSDYNQAIAIDPKMPVPYYLRGLIKEQKGDLDGAIADSTQAITFNPDHAEAYCNRGLARLGKEDLNGALSDLKKFCELAPRDDDADDARLYIWLISKKQNPTGDADSALSSALSTEWNSTPSDLTSQIAAFLLGRISENDLIAAADSNDPGQDQRQHCKTWYFAGIKKMLMGNQAGAATCFRKSLATQAKGYCEYIFAGTELKNLNQSP